MRQMQFKPIFVFMILAIMLMSLFSPSFVFAEGDSNDVFGNFDIKVDSSGNLSASTTDTGATGWAGIISKYKSFIVGVAGVAAVTMVVLFIFQFIKLGQSAGNPKARAEALTGVLWTGVAAAGLGAVALITSLFYNSINTTTKAAS